MPIDLALPLPDVSQSLDFADARGFKDWLKLVPMINVRQAHEDVLVTLDKLNKSPIFPLERVKMLELLRDPVALLQEENTKRYLGKPFPLADVENTVWRANVRLWQAMSTGYRHCWQAALNDDASVAEYKALCGQRAIRYMALALREHHFAYRTIPVARWEEIYKLYNVAVNAGVAAKLVKDSLNQQTEVSSCDAAFIQALLLSASNPAGMSVRQIGWTDRLLDRWSNQTALLETLPDKQEKGVLAIKLDAPGNLIRIEPPEKMDQWRFLDIEPIGKSIKKRVKYLRAGESPAQLGLGEEYAAATAESYLFALYQEWCDLPVERSSQRRPTRPDVPPTQLVASIADVHTAINGKVFVQPDEAMEVRGRAIMDFQLYGGVSQHVVQTSKPVKEPTPEYENWRTDNESVQGMKLTRYEPGQRLIHNQLLAVRSRPDQPWMCGSVRWLKEGVNGEIEIGVRIMAGIPTAIAVRATGVNHHSHRFCPALLLPAIPALKTATSLIVPSGWFKLGRMVEVYYDGMVKRVKLDELAERGNDFERVVFAGDV